MRQLVDFLWTDAGDLLLEPNGKDFGDTRRYDHREILQRLKTELSSDQGNWLLQPDVGVGIQAIAGLPNTEETGALLQSRIEGRLISSGIVSRNALQVTVFPVSASSIAAVVEVRIGDSGVFVNIFYDLDENKLVFRST
jgi:hypothetical protein